MTDYYWDAGAAGNASIGGNWSPSGPPGSTDKAIFTSANSVEDCTMNIGSIGEIDIQDDYTGTITLGNDFIIGENVDNLMQGTAAAEFDCAGYDLTVSGTLTIGDGSVGMFFYPDTGSLTIGESKASTKTLALYINKGRLYGVNPAQTGADGDWDIYGSFVVGNSGYLNLTAGTTTIKSYAENGYTTNKDKVFGVHGLGGGSAPGRLLFDLTTVNSDDNPYIIDIADASGSRFPINQIAIRTSGAKFQTTNGLTINDCFIISGGTYDTLSISDGTTSTPLSVATGTCVVGYPEGGLNYGRSQLLLNDSYFISYNDTGTSTNVGNSGETDYGGPDNDFSGGSWASLCWKGNAVIDGGTATIITANCNARNLDTSTRETGFYTPSGTGSLTVFKKSYSSYSVLRAWSAGNTSEQLYGTSGTTAERNIIIKTNANEMIIDASQSNQTDPSFAAQLHGAPNNINFYNLHIEPGYNGYKGRVDFSTGTYSGGGCTIFNNLYIASGCSLQPRMQGNMWYGGGSVAVSGGTRGTIWIDGTIHCSGNFNWNPWNASAEKTGWTKQMARFPTVIAKNLYIYDGGTFEAVPPKPIDGVGGATGDNWDGHTATTTIGSTISYDENESFVHNNGTILLDIAPATTGNLSIRTPTGDYGAYNVIVSGQAADSAYYLGAIHEWGTHNDFTINAPKATGNVERACDRFLYGAGGIRGNFTINEGEFQIDSPTQQVNIAGDIYLGSGATMGGSRTFNVGGRWTGLLNASGNITIDKDATLFLPAGGTTLQGSWINNGGEVEY